MSPLKFCSVVLLVLWPVWSLDSYIFKFNLSVVEKHPGAFGSSVKVEVNKFNAHGKDIYLYQLELKSIFNSVSKVAKKYVY